MKRYAVFNRGLRRLPGLAEMLDAEIVAPRFAVPDDVSATLGWGRRRHSARARRVAVERGIPFLCLEDGFLRSMGLGRDEPPLSVVVDDLGIYYDATSPSRLEALVVRARDDAERRRARALVARWREGRLSKYNHARDAGGDLPNDFVLVVDQTLGDASIACGRADRRSFADMLDAALDEHPRAHILLKVHPDVVAGYKRGHFDALSAGQASRVRVIGADLHPAGLLASARAVYAVTSQMGFEALLWHRPVRTFGMPFYAGWGLTDDALAAPVRRVEATRPSLDDLVHAALIEYPRYRDPETGRRCEVEAVADWLALQRRMQCRFPEEVHALDFSRWKKPIVRAFFGGSRVRFVACESDVPVGATLAVWGRRAVDATQPREVVRLEDGFLRSVGLGAALVQPLSWVMDRRGLYYDPTAPSDLEHLLEHATFTPALRERARALRERIVEARLTKYNVGSASWRRPSGQRRVILVPGQVESDASIACGTHEVRTNLGLLMAVRRAEPDAYIVYKPHPDVVARLRAAGTGEADAASWCDEVVTDGAMGDLLTEVDEVHLMTSLTGFEALLRGKRVVAHGLPFYAGWGLTDDRCHTARRNRRLTLDELVAGVLVLYPTYVSRVTGRFTTPERALVELSEWRTQARASSFLRMALARPLLARAAARRTAPADAMGRTCAASPHPLRPERRTGEAP